MPPPAAPQSTPPVAPQKPGSTGPLFGIIIVICLLLVGAFYFWGERLNQQSENPPPYIPADTGSTTQQ